MEEDDDQIESKELSLDEILPFGKHIGYSVREIHQGLLKPIIKDKLEDIMDKLLKCKGIELDFIFDISSNTYKFSNAKYGDTELIIELLKDNVARIKKSTSTNNSISFAGMLLSIAVTELWGNTFVSNHTGHTISLNGQPSYIVWILKNTEYSISGKNLKKLSLIPVKSIDKLEFSLLSMTEIRVEISTCEKLHHYLC
jgi:hypothetical protein